MRTYIIGIVDVFLKRIILDKSEYVVAKGVHLENVWSAVRICGII